MMYAIKIPQEGSQSFFKIVIFCNTQRQGEIKKKATIYMFTGKKIFFLLKSLRIDTFNIELLQLQLQLLYNFQK